MYLKIIFFYIIASFYCFYVNAQTKKYPDNFGDIFNSNKYFLGKNIFKGDVGYSITKVSNVDSLNILNEYYRNSAKINLNINPWKDLFLRSTFYLDLTKSDISPPWLADYFYQLGYYNWRSKTFSFGYENYQPNRWHDTKKNSLQNLRSGYFFVSYKYIFSKPEERESLKPLFWDKTSGFVISPFVKVHPEYQDENNEFDGYLKPITGVNLRYIIIKNIYAEAGLYYYPLHETKLPWDPDFTYGFGMYDWRAFKINVSYGNWIVNRFPWNEKEIGYYKFLNGEFNIAFTYSW
ncbi:MAG: hypothetical protein ACR2GN_10050 [Bacteroidia bacterium]